MNDSTHEHNEQADSRRAERREFLSYVWGVGLALVLTLVPYGLVKWKGNVPLDTLFIVIGLLGLTQMVVHFRFFLHLGFHRKREDLDLILFSTLVLVILVGGTVWIMASLAMRMALPGHP